MSKATPICPACKNQYPPEERFCPLDGIELLQPQANADARVGTLIGNYNIIDKLGEGGMGVVYRAEHPTLQRQAAIKLLHNEFSKDPEIVARFLAEARAVNKIRHKHILEVFDLGRTPDGAAYLIAELLVGEDLGQRLKREKLLPLPELCTILCQVCDALQAAHAAGIVHRDLKPGNIFLCNREGEEDFVKIVDFGIAKITEGETQNQTKTGFLLGSPHYISPEQATGKKQLDGRADLYSLGVILYQCFTGEVPFQSDALTAIIMHHMLTKPNPPKKAAPHRQLPDELDALTMKLLEKDPSLRYQKANDVRAILARYAKEGTVRPLQTTPAPGIPASPQALPTPEPRLITPAPILSYVYLAEKLSPFLEAAKQRAEQLDPKTRLLGTGIGVGLMIALFVYVVSLLFGSSLPKECEALFKMACDCEAVRVSNCEQVQSGIKSIEAQLIQTGTPQENAEETLRTTCQETARRLEPVHTKFCGE